LPKFSYPSRLAQAETNGTDMNTQLSLKKIFLGLLILTAILSGLTLAGLSNFSDALNESNRANSSRYDSYLLADELRQSSDDLTRLARTYVVTGDEVYERQYFDTLDVRNGKKPRPDGSTVPLRELMRKAGFTEQKFAKLKAAEDASNGLVKAETIAMNAAGGCACRAGRGTRQARLRKRSPTAVALIGLPSR
jgi:methyl-accepting chemotaxis protein